MLLSTTPERLDTCRFVSRYSAIKEFFQTEIIRKISTGGIDVTDNKESELSTVIDLFVPYEKDSHIKPGTVLKSYVKGPYTLYINQGEGFPISHSYRITRNSSL
ncbi:hypothetical protein KBD33_04205 [Candidatus Gracilibacteria bacterium]|nr:hypothetical protein [Candidatus Gracilibacteria bacterium]